jgi:hypothetical protein
MREAGQLNRAAHVTRVTRRRRQLIDRLMTSSDNRRRDQGHSAAHHIHGNYVKAFAFVGRQLPEIGAKQIR